MEDRVQSCRAIYGFSTQGFPFARSIRHASIRAKTARSAGNSVQTDAGAIVPIRSIRCICHPSGKKGERGSDGTLFCHYLRFNLADDAHVSRRPH